MFAKDLIVNVDANDYIDYKIKTSTIFSKFWNYLSENKDDKMKNKYRKIIAETINSINDFAIDDVPSYSLFIDENKKNDDLKFYDLQMVNNLDLMNSFFASINGKHFDLNQYPIFFSTSSAIANLSILESCLDIFDERTLGLLLFDNLFITIGFDLYKNDLVKMKMHEIFKTIKCNPNGSDVLEEVMDAAFEDFDKTFDFEKLLNLFSNVPLLIG